MIEQELRDAIANYLLTLENIEIDEYWGTPREIAEDFLKELLDHTFPNKVKLRILELNKELESLEEQTAKLSEELIELNKELKEIK